MHRITARPRRALRAAIIVCVALSALAAVLSVNLRNAGDSHARQQPRTSTLGTSRLGSPSPRTPPAATTSPQTRPADLQQGINAAYGFAHQRGYRLGIAVTDLASGKTWHAADPGTFGTGSVIKALIAAKMLLTDAMHGADADEAYHMITYSDDEDGTDLWTRYGADQIISWLGDHYGVHFGEPNRRPNFWGNTQVTAQSLALFYRMVSKDPAVGPWLFNAMAHAHRIASDGTDQFYGIPRAGGGQTVKQSWGIHSAGNGYGEDATVNSTGIVTMNGHRYAVVILTEGHGNDSDADSRGYVRAQGEMITEVARIVIAALHAGGQ